MASEDFERLNVVLTARDRQFAQALDRQTRKIDKFVSNTNRGLQKTDRAFQSTNKAADGMSKGFGRVLNVSSSGRFVLQNTSAQLGDMAVQLESGTAASRVMAQQLPQVFGGFGALGGALGIVAPLLGTVAAVGIPIGAMLMSMGGGAEEAAEDVETFAEALSAAHTEMETAEAALKQASGAEDLGKIYDGVAVKVDALADALADIELRAAAQSTGAALRKVLEGGGLDTSILAQGDKIANAIEVMKEYRAENARIQEALKSGQDWYLLEEYGSKGAAFDRTNELIGTINELRAAVPDLQEFAGALGTTEARARELVSALAAASSADGPAQMQEAYIRAADVISTIRAELEAAGADVRVGLAAELTHTEGLLRENVQQIETGRGAAEGLAGAASGIAPEISAANDEAAALVGNLGAAMAKLAGITRSVRMEQARAIQEAQIRQETIGDPEARASRLARRDYQEDSGAAAYAMISSGNSGRLDELSETADAVADGAARVAAAEEALAEAEAKFRESEREERKSSKGGGGSGGKSEAERARKKEARELERERERSAKSYEATQDRLSDAFTEASATGARYRGELEALRAAYKSGDLSAEDFQDGMKGVEERFRENAQAAGRFRDSAASAFSSIITGASSVGDALSGLLSQWAGMFANAGFKGLMNSGAGGGVFDALGSFLSFDGGGNTPGGPRSGGLDGKGGFLAMMHPQESVIDHTKRGGGGAGGGSVNVSFSPVIDARGADQAAVDRLSAELQRLKSGFSGDVVRTVRDAKTRRIL